MPTIFTHAIAATAVVSATKTRPIFDRWWVVAAILSMLPDADVIGFRFGVHYGDLLGHRGLTHSLSFAAVVAFLAIVLMKVNERAFDLAKLWAVLFVAIASHGVLDAMTSGGLGVAFLSPFSNERYFFSWRPIRVSPIGIGRFFSP